MPASVSTEVKSDVRAPDTPSPPRRRGRKQTPPRRWVREGSPDEIDIAMDVEGPQSKGSMIGSAGIIVMDDTVSIPEALMVVARFYAHESCGQCTPCRESTGWIYKMTKRLVEGKGRKEDLDTILDVAKRGAGTTICAFYDGAVGPYISYIEKYRSEFEDLIRSEAPAESRSHA